MTRTHFGTVSKTIVTILLFALIVALQYDYDLAKPLPGPSSTESAISPEGIRMIDMGFNPGVASFLWASTMPEFLDLFFHGNKEYFTDLAFVNGVDPKLSYPYAFSVLTLPLIPTSSDPGAMAAAMTIGQEGLQNADPDWRIPYYMATNYYLWIKDEKDAQIYYNIAAQTPGIPGFAKRFAINFGIGTSERQTTEELWETIRDSTNDPTTKATAQAYIDRLQIFDYLDAASKAYKQKYGVFPSTPQDLVTKGIIPAVPQDPFGFNFVINKDGTSGIDTTQLPPGYSSALQ